MPPKPELNRRRRPISARVATMRVVRRLHENGCQALLAGGCVRDMLLGQTPHDYDIATDATPEAIIALFPRTLTVGAQFGVVVVLIGGHQIEVATFRSEDLYHDGRRPSQVVFTDARHDAERRDFTINGMFLDPLNDQVIDYVGGRGDLDAALIRAIGDPRARFAEDHLRMLRAVRFAARFDFAIEPKTWSAIQELAPNISRISAERIGAEVERIIAHPNRQIGLTLARDSGLLAAFVPSLTDSQTSIGLDLLGRLPTRSSSDLALAALFVDCTPDQAGQICRDLRTSNQLRQHVAWLVTSRPVLLRGLPLTRGRLKKWLAEPLFEPLLKLTRAYLHAVNQSDAPLRQLRHQINQLGDEPVAPAPLLNGHDLIRLGAQPGPMVGQLAEELYLAQLENHVRTKGQAQTWVADWLKNHCQQ